MAGSISEDEPRRDHPEALAAPLARLPWESPGDRAVEFFNIGNHELRVVAAPTDDRSVVQDVF